MSLTRALVGHFVLKGDDGCITGDIALIITITKLLNFCVLAKISEASEELLLSPDPPREAGKHHDNFRMYHRIEIFHMTVQPNAVHPSEYRDHSFVFRIVHPEAPLSMSAQR